MSITKRQASIAVFAGLILSILVQASLAGTFRDNFADGDMVGWKPNIAASISVVNEKLQFKGPDALIVKVGDPLWTEYSLEAQLMIAKSVSSGWFSTRIMQGSTGELSGYYEIRLSRSGILAALYVNNRCMESFRVPTIIEENVWHHLRINPSNGKVSFYLDDALVAQLTDMGLSGYADMCSTKGTHVYIDNVAISGPNISSTGPSGPNSFGIERIPKQVVTWAQAKGASAF